MTLKSINTAFPKGYKEWLQPIKDFDKFHRLLPAHLREFNFQDGWLQCFNLNCYDSQALSIVMGYLKMPKKKRVQDRPSQYEKELTRFMWEHQIGSDDWDDDWNPVDFYNRKYTPLMAVDIILGYQPLDPEDEAA